MGRNRFLNQKNTESTGLCERTVAYRDYFEERGLFKTNERIDRRTRGEPGPRWAPVPRSHRLRSTDVTLFRSLAS